MTIFIQTTPQIHHASDHPGRSPLAQWLTVCSQIPRGGAQPELGRAHAIQESRLMDFQVSIHGAMGLPTNHGINVKSTEIPTFHLSTAQTSKSHDPLRRCGQTRDSHGCEGQETLRLHPVSTMC